MSYAGVCSPNLQRNADAMFHAGSQQQIFEFLDSVPNCGTTKSTGKTPPTVDAGKNYTIPASTPFMLSATSSNDANLTYTWDQMDLGGVTNTNEDTWADDGKGPLFRSFAPSQSSVRTFPKLSAILSNKLTSSFGERLPTTNRELNFRVTARSDQGMAQDDVTLTVDANAGPFKITAPVGVSFNSGDNVTVQWDVANTDKAPINCSEISIDLSTDNGQNFSTTLINSTANDGSEQVSLPQNLSGNIRFRVKCNNNIFFAVSQEAPIQNNEPGSGNVYLSTGLENSNNSIYEGNDGITKLNISVIRQYANETITVNYGTFSQDDFSGASPASAEDFANGEFPIGTLTLQKGERQATFAADIAADTVLENHEYFYVWIDNASGGTITNNLGIVYILNDDEAADNTGDNSDDNSSGDNNQDSNSGDNTDDNNSDNNSDNNTDSNSGDNSDMNDDTDNDDTGTDNDSNSDSDASNSDENQDTNQDGTDNGNNADGDSSNSDSNSSDNNDADNTDNANTDTNTDNADGNSSNNVTGKSDKKSGSFGSLMLPIFIVSLLLTRRRAGQRK
jgi:hypothetical protein